MIKLLWTGGWDSTYRLLYVTVVEKKNVQPYYILDKSRPSYWKEIETMDKIKEELYFNFPFTRNLIQETIMVMNENIPVNTVITTKYKTLKAESFIGSQYDWLARYADKNNIKNLELCVHLDDKAAYFVKKHGVKKDLDSAIYILDPQKEGSNYDIFKYYDFPILDLTKLEMQNLSQKFQFVSLMELTWFCYNPMKNGSACGYCNPCKYTREEGMSRRVPSNMHGQLNRVENKILRNLKKFF